MVAFIPSLINRHYLSFPQQHHDQGKKEKQNNRKSGRDTGFTGIQGKNSKIYDILLKYTVGFNHLHPLRLQVPVFF